MSEHPMVGVFGISGVGKSSLIAKACQEVPNTLHLRASDLIKEGVADPIMLAEALRQCSGEQIRANQDVLVEAFRRKAAQHKHLILFDGHLVIDTDNELVEVPASVISHLRPSLMVHVEDDVARIASRRSRDGRRVRPLRSAETLHEHQQLSRRLCKAYARELGIGVQILRPDEATCFSNVLRVLQSGLSISSGL